ncbi:EF-hand domain-containing protein, partial [Akkermansiaceae bacterium]|nr:EF-hand domain-containing protein [Akkermansiaceae bacterium]
REARFNEMFAKADTNGDEVLSKEEVKAMLENHRPEGRRHNKGSKDKKGPKGSKKTEAEIPEE